MTFRYKIVYKGLTTVFKINYLPSYWKTAFCRGFAAKTWGWLASVYLAALPPASGHAWTSHWRHCRSSRRRRLPASALPHCAPALSDWEQISKITYKSSWAKLFLRVVLGLIWEHLPITLYVLIQNTLG